MFKLMLRYNNEGDYIDTVYPPCEYSRAVALLKQYRNMWGSIHSYILVEVTQEQPQDTPMAEAYGG